MVELASCFHTLLHRSLYESGGFLPGPWCSIKNSFCRRFHHQSKGKSPTSLWPGDFVSPCWSVFESLLAPSSSLSEKASYQRARPRKMSRRGQWQEVCWISILAMNRTFLWGFYPSFDRNIRPALPKPQSRTIDYRKKYFLYKIEGIRGTSRSGQQDSYACDAWVMSAQESGPPGAQEEQEDSRATFFR